MELSAHSLYRGCVLLKSRNMSHTAGKHLAVQKCLGSRGTCQHATMKQDPAGMQPQSKTLQACNREQDPAGMLTGPRQVSSSPCCAACNMAAGLNGCHCHGSIRRSPRQGASAVCI